MFLVYSCVGVCTFEHVIAVQSCEVVVVWLRVTEGNHAGAGTHEDGLGMGGLRESLAFGNLSPFVRLVSLSIVRGEYI